MCVKPLQSHIFGESQNGGKTLCQHQLAGSEDRWQSRSLYTCGMIHEREIIAHVQPSPLALQARRRLQSTYFTVRCLQKRKTWPPRLRLMVVQGAVLPPLALFIAHAQWKVNEWLYPDCATFRFGKSWVNRSELLWFSLPDWRDHLEFSRVASWLPASVQGSSSSTNYDPFDDDVCATKQYKIHLTVPIQRGLTGEMQRFAGNMGIGHPVYLTAACQASPKSYLRKIEEWRKANFNFS